MINKKEIREKSRTYDPKDYIQWIAIQLQKMVLSDDFVNAKQFAKDIASVEWENYCEENL